MRLLLPLGAMLSLLLGPFLLAEASGWDGGRSFSEELGATLGISALGVLAVVLILPTRLRVLARLGADAAVRLHRHLVGVLLALLVGHIVLAVALQPARYLGVGAGTIGLGLLVGVPLRALATLRFPRRPRSTYVLERVVPEAGRSTSVILRAQDHGGQAFEPGQFAWLRLSDQGTRFAEHPFSYTSSAEHPSQIAFAVRAYEGFSARIARLPVGTRFEVDGPHGGFRARARASGVLLVAYGIGITPSVSILRTAADRADGRAFVLIYANRTIDDVTFAEDLDELRDRLNLRIVHVLSRPPARWSGESGRITADLLKCHLPADLSRWDFFLCGAGAPVDSGTAALADIGVPPEQVHAERFVEV